MLPIRPNLLLELSVKSLGPSMLAENLQIRNMAAHLLHLLGDLRGLGVEGRDCVFEGCCL